MKKLIYFSLGLFLTGCSRTIEVKIIQPVRQKVETYVTTTSTGTIEAESDTVLGFGVAGRVAHVYLRLGDLVKKGQLIAELENQDVRSGVEMAQTEWIRNQELFKSSLIAKSALDESRRSFDVAKTSYDRTRLVAPFDGIISEHNLKIGELFQMQDTSGRAAVRLVDLKPRRVKGRVDEVEMAKVKLGQVARIRIQAVRPEPFTARVVRMVPYISTTKDQDRTAEVYLQIEKGGAEIPVGASADVEIIVGQHDQALSLPSRAVLGVGSSRYVWKVENSHLKKQNVRLGMINYERVEILEGVREGESLAIPSDTAEFSEGAKIRGQE